MATNKRRGLVTEETPEIIAEEQATETPVKEPKEEDKPEEPQPEKSGYKAPEKAPKTDVKTTDAPKATSYTVAELKEAYGTFGTSYEIVAVALRLAGVERATVEEARQIIEEFKNKEVK